MELGYFRSSIVDGDSDQRFFRIGLGILHKDIEITIFIENTRVE